MTIFLVKAEEESQFWYSAKFNSEFKKNSVELSPSDLSDIRGALSFFISDWEGAIEDEKLDSKRLLLKKLEELK